MNNDFLLEYRYGNSFGYAIKDDFIELMQWLHRHEEYKNELVHSYIVMDQNGLILSYESVP